MKIALVANTSWYLYNFRRNLMSELKSQGHQVIAIGSADDYALRLKGERFSQRAISFNQAGVNPAKEMRTVHELRKIFLSEDVDVVLSWTPKGNIYSALALIGQRRSLIANVSGLGRAFVHRNWITLIVRRLLKISLGRANVIFFQNKDDRDMFIANRLVDEKRSLLLPGSGVDLSRFQPRPSKASDDCVCVLMISRLLWSKGIQEYVDAARVLQREDSRWKFQILGALDESGSSGVQNTQLQTWISEGVIEYLGTTDDVRDAIAQADCVVLPSYREGLPRSMLEASAMARPILTTNVPGCKDCVDDGVNGFLFQPHNANDLIRVLNKFKGLNNDARISMGSAGRHKVEMEFDERIVIDRYLLAINALGK